MTFRNHDGQIARGLAICGLAILALSSPLSGLATAQALPNITYGALTLVDTASTGGAPFDNNNNSAYDDKHNVYLVVYEDQYSIYGRFVSTAGAVIGSPFKIGIASGPANGIWEGFPIVTYSAGTGSDVFCVMYQTNAAWTSPPLPNQGNLGPNINLQFVQFNGSGGTLVGAAVPAEPFSSVRKAPDDIQFNPASNRFIAVWDNYSLGNAQVYARAFNPDGSAATGVVVVAPGNQWDGAAYAAVDWQNNRVIIGYSGASPHTGCGAFCGDNLGIWAQILDGSTLAVLSPSIIPVFPSGSVGAYEVNVTFLPERGGFLFAWTNFAPGRVVQTRFVPSVGAGAMPTFPAAAVTTIANDSSGLAQVSYDAGSRDVFVAAMSNSRYLRGAVLDANGNQLGTAGQGFIISGAAVKADGTGGTFNPKVINNQNGTFAVSYEVDFQRQYLEFYGLPLTSTRGPAYSAAATLVSPLAGSKLPPSGATFTWNASATATAYTLSAGSTLGGFDFFPLTTTVGLSMAMTNLPVRGTIYVRLTTTLAGGSSASNDYTFVALGAAPGDIDGDAKADIAVYRPSSGTWYIRKSSAAYGASASYSLGTSTDLPVPGDYDGDGLMDIAVYRPSTGVWYILTSSSGYTTTVTYTLGSSTDIPVPGDYDGDGKTDPAVYRPSTGTWYVLLSGSGYTTATLTLGTSTSIPVPGDYDGDGKMDPAVYQPSTGTWSVRLSGSSFTTTESFQWGMSTDVPVPGDYDGDGKTDIAVFRPSTGKWYILLSGANYTTSVGYTWGVSTDVPVPADYDGDGKTDIAVFRPSTGVWYLLLSGANFTTSASYNWGTSTDLTLLGRPGTVAAALPRVTTSPLASMARYSDFDGDAHSDVTYFRPVSSNSGTWATLKSSTNFTTSSSVAWGQIGDIPVTGDYDGDGKTDAAVFRPSTGVWYIKESSTNNTTSLSYTWGASTDIPVPGDYDGDGRTDIAVYRPSTGMWYILLSSSNYTTSVSYQWGMSADTPVPGDYDGDGKTDIAVFRPSTGKWYILLSSTNNTTSAFFAWGTSGDTPVPGDYDGDGKTDIAVFRPSTGTWYILLSGANYTTSAAITWGLSTDVAVPGDYDGDGKTDIAVFRPSNGTWYILKSSTNYATSVSYQWGISTDTPILKR
jgi:hypothetical protein